MVEYLYMKIHENVSLSNLTTMRLGGAARYVVELEGTNDIEATYDFASEKGLPVWVMGGGANTIAHDEGFEGVVLLNKLRGIEIINENDDEITIRAMGGEIWDDLVEFACERGYSGIEAMSKIPGTVGAAPVQNIGAYGQDIAGVIEQVEAYDTKLKKNVTLDKSEMGMQYRKSRFNTGEDKGRFLITAVTIKLQRKNLEPPFYSSLQRYIDEHKENNFSPKNIRRMVSKIREEKLPDPEKIPSAGSFFKNVYVDKKNADKAEQSGIPIWRNEDGSGKINSGWLIESCGLKGKEFYGFRVSDKAALVLINEKAKNYQDLAKARAEIIDAVREKFGFVLEQEPVEIPIHGGNNK